MAEIISLQQYKILKDIKEQTGINDDSSNLISAINDAFATATLIDSLYLSTAGDRARSGLEPNACYNVVCSNHRSTEARANYCNEEFRCHGCSYQMLDIPPSNLDYDTYMPSHQEALDLLEANNLLSGPLQERIEMASKYRKEGAVSQYERWQTEVKDITFEILQECIKNSMLMFINNESIDENVREVLDDWGERIIMSSMLEVEKAMCIFPNLKFTR